MGMYDNITCEHVLPFEPKPRGNSEIDFSDVPATTERDWRGAERGKLYRPVKRQLTVRIDADVIEWLKSQGRGYQSRLNEILRAAMLAKLRHR
jgi:uncharacterized protein (DUF4415 family)